MSKNISRIALVLAMLVVMPSAILAQKQKLQAVDLGLSVKWANMNVGASSPSEYGNYYAWGEIAEKRFYSKVIKSKYINIEYEDEQKAVITKLKYSKEDGLTQLQLSDDAASQNCGKSWFMPTQAHIKELINNCDWTLIEQNGTQGYLIKSRKNDNSIFLPLTGYMTGEKTKGTERRYCSTQGYYWSSTLANTEDKDNAVALSIKISVNPNGKAGSYQLEPFHRTCGCVIRPVTK